MRKNTEDNDDNLITLKQFPESSEELEEFQLPNHERCTTHT